MISITVTLSRPPRERFTRDALSGHDRACRFVGLDIGDSPDPAASKLRLGSQVDAVELLEDVLDLVRDELADICCDD